VNGAPDSAAAYLRRSLAEPPSELQRPDILLELGFAESYAVHLSSRTTKASLASCNLSVRKGGLRLARA
jgi:hypothetical protein